MALFPEREDGDGRAIAASKIRRFPDDDLLRACHFTIHSRPKGKPAIWRAPDGTLMEHKEAVALVNQKIRHAKR